MYHVYVQNTAFIPFFGSLEWQRQWQWQWQCRYDKEISFEFLQGWQQDDRGRSNHMMAWPLATCINPCLFLAPCTLHLPPSTLNFRILPDVPQYPRARHQLAVFLHLRIQLGTRLCSASTRSNVITARPGGEETGCRGYLVEVG